MTNSSSKVRPVTPRYLSWINADAEQAGLLMPYARLD